MIVFHLLFFFNFPLYFFFIYFIKEEFYKANMYEKMRQQCSVNWKDMHLVFHCLIAQKWENIQFLDVMEIVYKLCTNFDFKNSLITPFWMIFCLLLFFLCLFLFFVLNFNSCSAILRWGARVLRYSQFLKLCKSYKSEISILP